MCNIRQNAEESFKKQIDPDKSQVECFFHYTDEMIYVSGYEQGYIQCRQDHCEHNLEFDDKHSVALYRIFCGLTSSCYDHAEVYDRAKPDMKEVFDKIIEWGRVNKIDSRGRE